MRDLISHVGTDYLAFALTGVLALIVTLVYLWWNEQSAGKLTCPGLKPQDENLGNLGSIDKDGGLHRFLSENHKKLGHIFSFYWGKELAVSLASPVLWKDVAALFDRPVNQYQLYKPMIGESSIQYLNASIGRKHRQMHDRHFSFTAIKSFFHIFSEISKELQKKWTSLGKDEHIALHQHMLAIAMKSIIKTSFGNDYFKSNKEILQFEVAYQTCEDEIQVQLDGNMPEPGSQRQKNFDKALQYMKEKVIQIVNHRRALKQKTSYNFLDILIDEENLYPHDEQIVDMVMTYLVGGFDTTGNLLTWVFYYLCTHPEVEQKLLKEIEEQLGAKDIEMEDIEKLKYTRQVLDETLRCSVLAASAARYSDFDIVVGGHIIPKQTHMILALGTVLHDESIWTEPKKFDPDRFNPEEVKKRHPLAFQPFGFAGKRKCPGYRFAYYESTVFLVDIIRKFKVKLVDGQKVEMQHRIVTVPKEEIWITVKPRV